MTSPKSFIQLPSLDAIVELHDWPETGSDEDGSGEAQPLLLSGKASAQVEADSELYERYKALFKTHLKGRFPLALRKLLARFIAVQHRGDETSNIYRYSDIIGLITQATLWSYHFISGMHAVKRYVHGVEQICTERNRFVHAVTQVCTGWNRFVHAVNYICARGGTSMGMR